MSDSRKKPSGRHAISMRALIVIRCACGWFHRIEQIRGKSDYELSNEIEGVFLEHCRKMEVEGY